MKCVIDTNLLLAISNSENPKNKDAMKVLRKIKGDILIPKIVLAESLIYSTQLKNSIQSISEISNQFIDFTEKDLEFFEQIPIKLRKSLKSNDCLILAICKRYKAELYTYDTKLEKAYADYVKYST